MLTIEQINDVHARLGSAKRSRNVPALKGLGVERHDSFLGVGHSEYFGPEGGGGNYISSCNYVGSQTGCGVVYRMSRHGSDWIFNILSSFDGANGYNPGQLIRVAPDWQSLYHHRLWRPGRLPILFSWLRNHLPPATSGNILPRRVLSLDRRRPLSISNPS